MRSGKQVESGVIFVSESRERLDKFLAQHMPEHSRTKLAKLIDSEKVLVDGIAQKPSFHLEPGMRVELDEPEAAQAHNLDPANIPLEVLFEDEFLIVLNKPRGLAAHPAASLKEPSLVNALLARNTPLSSASGDFRPGIVHRLDKETTGLMVVAKDDTSHVRLARQMESKTAERRYFAVVAGDVERDKFTVDAPLMRNRNNRILMAVDPAGKPAVSHIKKIAKTERGTIIGVRLETGRTHQIRVHLSAIGMPVLGDRLYAPKMIGTGALQLHAGFLSFNHPATDERVSFYTAPDTDFFGYDLVKRSDLEEF